MKGMRKFWDEIVCNVMEYLRNFLISLFFFYKLETSKTKSVFSAQSSFKIQELIQRISLLETFSFKIFKITSLIMQIIELENLNFPLNF